MKPIFKLNTDTFTVRGVPHEWDWDVAERKPARLFLDGEEVPVTVLSSGSPYERWWTWGKPYVIREADDHRQTVEAIANHFITDPELARLLWPLLNRLYLENWPIDAHFNQEINILDFLIDNKAEIEEAQAELAAIRKDAQQRQAHQQYLTNGLATPIVEQQTHEQCVSLIEEMTKLEQPVDLTTISYGPGSETYWLEIPTIVPDLDARCRVDVFFDSALIIVTDIGTVSVENNIEYIVGQVCQQLPINARRIRLLQRYQQDANQINEVSFLTTGRGVKITDPDWHQRTPDEFSAIVSQAGQISQKPARWLAGLIAGFTDGFSKVWLSNVPKWVGPR